MPYSDSDLDKYMESLAAPPKGKAAEPAKKEEGDELDKYMAQVAESRAQPQQQVRAGMSTATAWSAETPKEIAAAKEFLKQRAKEELAGAPSPTVTASMKGFGSDIISLPSRALGMVSPRYQKTADYMNRFADAYQQAAEEIETERGSGATLKSFKRAARGVGRTVPQAVITAPLGPYGIIGQAAIGEANQAITEAKDAGLKGHDVFNYALAQGAIEGSVAGVFQKVGLGGAEKILGGKAAAAIGVSSALKQVGVATLQELPEEVITELGHSVARSMSGVDPKATSPASLAQTTADTTIQTLLTMGLIGGGRAAGAYQVQQAQQQAAPEAAPVSAPVAEVPNGQKILDLANKKIPPSRREWKDLGLDPEQGKTLEGRKKGIQTLADEVRQSQPVETLTEQPATEAAIVESTEAVRPEPIPVEPVTLPFIEELKARNAAQATEVEGLLKGETGAAAVGGRLNESPKADIIGGAPAQTVTTGLTHVDARMEAAPKLGDKTRWDKIKEWAEEGKHVVTRAQQYIPDTAEFAPYNESFRFLKMVKPQARTDAFQTVAAILKPVEGKNQYKLFGWYTVLRNQLAAAEKGQPLRFGFKNKAEVETALTKLQEQVDATPGVQQAIEDRKRAVADIVAESVALKLLPEEALVDSDTYFHQQVRELQAAKAHGVGAATMRVVKKSFQKKRFQAEGVDTLDRKYDYNTDYIQAEMEWISDAVEQIRKQNVLDRMLAYGDRYDAFKQAADAANVPLSVAVDRSGTHAIWQPEPGNVFYKATSIPEKLAEQLHSGILKEAKLTKDELNQVLAMGSQKRPAVLPTEVVAQLNSMQKPAAPSWLGRAHKSIMTFWKQYPLLGPKSVLRYNVGNLIGDTDPAVAANPRIMGRIPEAASELWDQLKNPQKPVSADLREAMEYGVTSSGFFTSEATDAVRDAALSRFASAGENVAAAIKHPWRAYIDAVRPFSDLREDLLRYAAYKHYKAELASGGTVHYGAAKKPIVDNLRKTMGDKVAAAHLSRNLLGDYGNLTTFGGWIRDNIFPYWSFSEINLTRYPRLVLNAFQYGGDMQTAGTAASVARAYSTAALMRIGWLMAAAYAWNNFAEPAIFGGNGDDDLSDGERAKGHLNLGSTPEGDKRVFRNAGSLPDFLEWFGLTEAMALYSKVRTGQVTYPELAKEMAKAPFEKAWNMLRPDLKALREIPAGESTYPSVFSPRSVDKGELAAGLVGATQEYKWLKGMALGDGTRARKNYWLQAFGIGVLDRKAQALNEVYDLRNRYLTSKGSPEKGTFPISEYKIAREAAINEDYNAFVDWKKQFMKRHPTDYGARFFKAVRNMDPVSQRLSDADEYQFTQKFLNSEQKEKLKVARDYSQELMVRLSTWWTASAREQNRFAE